MAQKQAELLARTGARLRKLREERGLTQEQVAEGAGFSGKYISEIERGLRDVPLTTLERIAERGIHCSILDVLASAPPARGRKEGRALGVMRESRGLPRATRRLAEDIARLPAASRSHFIAIARAILALVRST
jgi:transcriptional regulator with XRE-family HTH domain